MNTHEPARRVRVTSPRAAGTRARRVPVTTEIDARTRLGEMYVSSLLRAQLRLGLAVLAVTLGPVTALPLLFRLFPEVARRQVVGMPLHWVLLAFVVYPALVAAAAFYVRRAERNERAFTIMVGSPGPGADDAGGGR